MEKPLTTEAVSVEPENSKDVAVSQDLPPPPSAPLTLDMIETQPSEDTPDRPAEGGAGGGGDGGGVGAFRLDRPSISNGSELVEAPEPSSVFAKAREARAGRSKKQATPLPLPESSTSSR